MESRKNEFKTPFYKVDMTNRLFQYAQESSRLRKKHIIEDRRLISSSKNTSEITIDEFIFSLQKIEKTLLSLELTSTKDMILIDMIGKLYQLIVTKITQETLRDAIVKCDIVSFMHSLINKLKSHSHILYELLKCIIVLSTVAYAYEDPFCEMFSSLEDIMSQSDANPNFICKEQVIWVIGNMSADCPKFINL